MRRASRLPLGLGVAVLVLLADQISKWWVLERLYDLPHPITLNSWHPAIHLTDFASLVMVWNRGVSFGLLGAGTQAIRWGLTVLALVVAAALVIWVARTGSRFVAVSLGLIIGGAVGNALDRVRFAAVADFIDIHVAGWHWPAFNLADSGITVGVVLLVVDSLLSGRQGTPRRNGHD